MLFIWEGMKMTVRICGEVEKMSPEESDTLFHRQVLIFKTGLNIVRCGPSEKFYYTYCSQGKDHPYSQSQVYHSTDEMQLYKDVRFKKLV